MILVLLETLQNTTATIATIQLTLTFSTHKILDRQTDRRRGAKFHLTERNILKEKSNLPGSIFPFKFISTNRMICITKQHELPQSGHKINNPKSKFEITRPSCCSVIHIIRFVEIKIESKNTAWLVNFFFEYSSVCMENNRRRQRYFSTNLPLPVMPIMSDWTLEAPHVTHPLSEQTTPLPRPSPPTPPHSYCLHAC